jgi:SAM-dependent methyltransferase
VESTEVRKLAALEDGHWWYRERRHVLARLVRQLTPGIALDIGAAAGGNTRVLTRMGWQALAVEFSVDGAKVASERDLNVVRGDASHLPIDDESVDLTVCWDVLEHLEDDKAALDEMFRVLRRSGTTLIAVPADPNLWSAHDEAVSHFRRYTRDGLVALAEAAGFRITGVRSWNVLMKPAVVWRRRMSAGSDLDEPPRWLNASLGAIIGLERYLPVGWLPGVSLILRAQRP